MKIWQKDKSNLEEVQKFTVGRDLEFDQLLAPFDVIGSMAHAHMLEEIGLITKEENSTLQKGLKEILDEVRDEIFLLPDDVEDVHSYVEFLLTERFGDVGKKLHSGRSRNDQVLVDLKLFYRDAIQDLVIETNRLFDLLISLADKHKGDLMPGYTHTQLAMPSSFGLWFSSFAEGLSEDMDLMKSAFKLSNKNPLGSAAGYGSSFPLNRTLTTELLGFEDLHHNVINAQNSRGKTEKTLAFAMSGIASTLNRLASDICIYMNQNFGFLTFPDELTTGSSIMPHKKNPDVFELIRSKTNQIIAIPGNLSLILTNLTTGYHRDLQLLKEDIFPGMEKLKSCLQMTTFMLESVKIQKDILEDGKYKHLFSVESVNELVLKGVPFRDAYRQVGLDIENGNYNPNPKDLEHSHEGSIGNLNLNEIRLKMQKVVESFDFQLVEDSINRLIEKN